MPITTEVAALPGAGQRPLGAYLISLASGEPGPPDVLAVPVEPGPAGTGNPGSPGSPATDQALDDLLPASPADVLAAHRLTGKAGESAQVVVTIAGRAVTVLLLGVGDRSLPALRRAGAELGRRMAAGGTAVTSAVAGESDAGIQAFAEGVLLGGYRFDLKSGQEPPAQPGEARLLVAADVDAPAALRRAETIAGAVALARDLTNVPSVVKSPQWLAEAAVHATADHDVTVRVWSETELAESGFGGIVAVGSGSARPPRLIELSYRPDGAQPDGAQRNSAQSHIVLVGKGITFDSGGLSLKSNDGMKTMKTDMAGGAVVIAVMAALSRLGVRHRVTGLVATAENMPSGSAYRPGDVITQYGGRTVEVLNTDAEGRLVLADALAYAAATLQPDRLIDIATLTGAARVALGTTHAAMYATDDELARSLVEVGQASGDRVWRMPLEDSYATSLASDVADLAHVSRDGGGAGSITAALFLREFSGGLPWAHLDIAGAGRSTENDGEFSKGATGFGARLLLRLLTQD